MEFPRKENVEWKSNGRPLRFQVLDWFVPEADKSVKHLLSKARQRGEPIEYPEETPEYEMVMFGCTEEGYSVTAQVTGFIPYFYVKVPEHITQKHSSLVAWVNEFYLYLTSGKYTKTYGNRSYPRSIIPYKLASHLVSVKEVRKKEFYGFTNQEDFIFLKISVKSLALFQSLRSFFQYPPKEFLEKYKEPFRLYESNLDPFLRFIHLQNLQPCGWVELPAQKYQIIANGCEDDNYSRANISVSIHYSQVKPFECNQMAPLTIVSFDLECTSSHGDFPVAKKDYRKLAKDMCLVAKQFDWSEDQWIDTIFQAYSKEVDLSSDAKIHRLYPLDPIDETRVRTYLKKHASIWYPLIAQATDSNDITTIEEELKTCLDGLPKLQGDAIIQIGTTVHRYGSDEIIYRNIITLKSCDPIEGAEVQSYATEQELLLAWKGLIQRLDPDILMGYNIFGFDMPYLWNRVEELFGDDHEYGVGFGRLSERNCQLLEQKLASSALGENFMYYLDIDGVVSVDVYKVMMRDHKLDSYKLDFVSEQFLGDHKNDLTPNELFKRYLGTSYDRKVIAEYCLQDCALVNRLFHKLKILENNAGMGNVCTVPLSYLFMRGQGIKIFSLVANECRKNNMAIPVLKSYREDAIIEEEGYEGAIVLEPKVGMYLEDAITVLDYASLYPSSMIERNLSHDCYVNDEKYDNLPGVDYMTVSYDIYEGTGDKKTKVGEKKCKFVQLANQEKGIIPRILRHLLTQRKNTRKKMEYQTITTKADNVGAVSKANAKEVSYTGLVSMKGDQCHIQNLDSKQSWTIPVDQIISQKDTYNSFEKDVFDALQLAYKVTANSLYGQIGSRVSPIYLKDIAASTTATGRERIMMAKDFVEKNYQAEVIYGDTDSIFIKFPFYRDNGERIRGKETLALGIEAGQRASEAINQILPPPQNLEYEKTFYPFILLSKKRYVGNLYEDNPNKKPKQKSMGIVLKRRDNPPLVKKIYGGVVDILLNQADMAASVDFLKTELSRLVQHEYPLEDFILTKTLRSYYKDPTKIAHKVLADRMGVRDPGNKPQVNDRIPFLYIQLPEGSEVKLQGDRIEHPTYVREHGLKPDYSFYITNQLINPITQLYELCLESLPGYAYPPSYWEEMNESLKSTKMYCDCVVRRSNRLASLRLKEVEDLLFGTFLEKKVKVKRVSKKETKVILPKHTLPTDAPTLIFDVIENKETKQYEATSSLMIQANCLETDTWSLPKKGLYNSKIKACPKLLYDVFKKYMETHRRLFEEKGIRLKIEETRYRKNLMKAVEESTDVYTKREKAIQEGDLEAVEQYNDMEKDLGLIQILMRFSYELIQ